MTIILRNPENGAYMAFALGRKRIMEFGRRDLMSFIAGEEVRPELEYVSNREFVIFQFPSGVYCIQNLSKNGICLDGENLGDVAEIRSGDIIRLGPKGMENPYSLQFLLNEPSSNEPLKPIGDQSKLTTEEFKGE